MVRLLIMITIPVVLLIWKKLLRIFIGKKKYMVRVPHLEYQINLLIY